MNADSYVSTGQGILGNNMFAYCVNNPIAFFDTSGEIATTAISIGFVLYEIGVLFIGLISAYVISDTLVKNPPAFPALSLPNIFSKSETDSKEIVLAPSIPNNDTQSTDIYRYHSSKIENLSPRPNIDYDGLSFSTNPPKPGVPAVMTTIEAVNSTGILRAILTGGSHVIVIPTNGTVLQWMNQGMLSIWSQKLSEIVIEMIG